MIKATLIPWTQPPLYLKNNRWYGLPGAFITREGLNENNWILCCPDCGQLGSPKDGAKWTYEKGNFDDVSTLTLSPSILKSCCGWHGYLRNGFFEKC